MRRIDHQFAKLACLVMAALLVGCGGGGGKSAGTSSQNGSSGSGQNSAPTIQGVPGKSVVPGQAYSFQPAATDADGDRLTFTASNLPTWATLDTSSGRITGTPTSADVATYSGITITVSDGKATAALSPFAITVSDLGTGTAMLSWLPPTENSDGSSLTDLAGYEVQYGRSASALVERIVLTNPSISTYMIENLSAGTWYFAVVAVNKAGNQSSLSNVATKTIS